VCERVKSTLDSCLPSYIFLGESSVDFTPSQTQRNERLCLKVIAAMKINQFFNETLGGNLRNPRWSWGAVDPMTNRVFLRAWEDLIDRAEDGERILVARDKPLRRSNGFPERRDHIAQIQNGATAFGVLCTAVDPDTTEARAIKSFDESRLLQLGELTHENGKTYARVVGRIPVTEIVRQRTGQSTLTEDLKTLVKKKIDTTTRDALVSARVGQGVFRSQVLQLWDNRCAVTRSTALDAIRASHAKPWRDSTDEERLDPHNGLPLVASLDAIFDAGLIAFESSGTLIVSPSFPETEQHIFAVESRLLFTTQSEATAQYLTYHRENVFRK
jgi:putative restriction endonuclease